MRHPAEQVKKQYTEYKREGSEIHLPPTSSQQKYPGASPGYFVWYRFVYCSWRRLMTYAVATAAKLPSPTSGATMLPKPVCGNSFGVVGGVVGVSHFDISVVYSSFKSLFLTVTIDLSLMRQTFTFSQSDKSFECFSWLNSLCLIVMMLPVFSSQTCIFSQSDKFFECFLLSNSLSRIVTIVLLLSSQT